MSLVLLLGKGAHGLAARLELSGYSTSCLTMADLSLPERVSELQLQPPGAVVLESNAREALPELRRILPGVPLLLDIGSDGAEGRVRCLSSGADDFWLSSAPPSDLLLRLRLHLSLLARARGQTPLLRLADLSIDPSLRLVKRGTRTVALTAREYGLLLHFLRHQGRILSREQILKEVWKDQQGVASNVIEVYVRYLRQKLEEGGERRLLHTVRGMGYSLSDGPPRQPSREP